MVSEKERKMLIAVLYKSMEESDDDDFIPGEVAKMVDSVETNVREDVPNLQ